MFTDLKEWAINALGLTAVSQVTSDAPAAGGSRSLSITAITAANNVSILECWQIANPFTASSQKGITGASVLQLGMNTNTSLVSIPPHFDGGLHVAPAVQYVVFVSGSALITVPEATGSEGALIQGGQGSNSIIFAADTAEVSTVGHLTQYTSDVETLAIPIKMAQIPEHIVLHSGPCGWQKQPDTSSDSETQEEAMRDEL